MPIAAGDERQRRGDETPYGVVGEYTNASAPQLLGHGFKKMHCGESREVGEVALALMLAAGAGLMIRSFNKLQELDLGFAPSGVLSAQVLLPAARYPVNPAQFRPQGAAPPAGDTKPFVFFDQLEARLRATAGIESVGAVSALPLNPIGTDYDLPVIVEGKPRQRAGEELQADFRVATVGYFRTMRIPFIAGRAFTEFDGAGTTPVVIINDTLARLTFAGENPIGRRLFIYGRPRQIVGVVGSVRCPIASSSSPA